MIIALCFAGFLFASSICCGMWFKSEVERKYKQIPLWIVLWIVSLLACATMIGKVAVDSYTAGATAYMKGEIELVPVEQPKLETQYRIQGRKHDKN